MIALVVRNAASMSTGYFVYGFAQWGMLLVVARLGSADSTGKLALGFALAAPIFLLSNMQLRILQATDGASEYHFYDYLWLRIQSSAIALVFLAGASYFIYGLNSWLVILLVGCAKAAESIGEVTYGYYQKTNRPRLVGRSLILKAVLSLGLLSIGIHFGQSLTLGVLLLAIGWGLVALRELRQISKEIAAERWTYQPRVLIELARLGAPLGIVSMLASLCTNTPKYVVERTFGTDDLGVLAVVSYTSVVGGRFVHALSQSLSGLLGERRAAGDRAGYIRLCLTNVSVSIATGIIMLVGMATVAPGLFGFVFGPEYGGSRELYLAVAIASAFEYVCISVAACLTASRITLRQLPIEVLALATVAVVTILTVPRIGIVGAPLALAAGFSFKAIIFALFLYTSLRRTTDVFTGEELQ